MARYNKYENYNPSWLKQTSCKGCGKQGAELAKEYYMCVIRYAHMDTATNRSVYCVPCYDKKMGRVSLEAVRSLPYTMGDVMKATKALELKLRVEGVETEIIKGLRQLAEGKEKGLDASEPGWDTYIAPIPRLIHNFPKAVGALASGRAHIGGTWKRSRANRGWPDIFIALARMLKPFLPKVTGVMLNKMYLHIAPEIVKKRTKRGELNVWRYKVANNPVRLFPLTGTKNGATKLIGGLMPKGGARTMPEESGAYKWVPETLSVFGIADQNNYYDISIRVYNGPKGPRFLVL